MTDKQGRHRTKREVVRRLGLRVELDQDDKNRHVRPVFVSPDLPVKRETLRIACASLVKTDLPRTIFRTCLTLPRKRIRRKIGGAS